MTIAQESRANRCAGSADVVSARVPPDGAGTGPESARCPDERPVLGAGWQRIFLAQHGHLLPRIFDPADGQLHVLQRLIAWAASAFATLHAPLIYNLAALACGAAALASLRNLEAFGLSFAIVLVTLVLVPTNGEVFGNLTNLEWLLQFYFVSMFARPLDRRAGHDGPAAAHDPDRGRGADGAVPDRRRRQRDFGMAVAASEQGYAGACSGLFIADQRRMAGARRLRRRAGGSLRVRCGSARRTCVVCVRCVCAVHRQPADPRVRGAAGDRMLLLVSTLALAWLAVRGAARSDKAFIGALALFVGIPLAATAHRFAAQPGLFLSLQDGDRYFLPLKMFFWWMLALAVARHVRRWNAAALGALLYCSAQTPWRWRRRSRGVPWSICIGATMRAGLTQARASTCRSILCRGSFTWRVRSRDRRTAPDDRRAAFVSGVRWLRFGPRRHSKLRGVRHRWQGRHRCGGQQARVSSARLASGRSPRC